MGTGKKCFICKIVGLLIVIGGINWGLVGFLNYNVVTQIFGDMTTASRVVYGLVGVAALIKLFTWVKSCPACCKKETCCA